MCLIGMTHQLVVPQMVVPQMVVPQMAFLPHIPQLPLRFSSGLSDYPVSSDARLGKRQPVCYQRWEIIKKTNMGVNSLYAAGKRQGLCPYLGISTPT